MKNKSIIKRNKNLLLITLLCLTIIFIATVIIGITFTHTKLLHPKGLANIITSEHIPKTYLFLFGEELPQFKDSHGDELKSPSLSNVSGIKTENFTKSPMQGVPGFNMDNTEIYIAGVGSNYSNLPQESPPPDFDELLSEQNLNGDLPLDKATEDWGVPNSYVHDLQNASVFIYHSHSWEGYLPLIEEDFKQSNSSSIDNSENVVLVGSLLSKKLDRYGIDTVHNSSNVAKELNDKGWDYRNSYNLTHQYIDEAMSINPDIEYLIDIHRDSARKENTTTTINGERYARLYFVVGKAHESFEDNLLFTKKIHENLEARYPGLSKGIYVKTKADGNGIYNQDLSNKSLLIEVGGIENTENELTNSVDAFAEVFKGVYEGVLEVNAQK